MKRSIFRSLVLSSLVFGFVFSLMMTQQSAFATAPSPCSGISSIGTMGVRPCPTPEPESEPGPPAENLYDDRINNSQGHDVAAPVAIYEGSVDVFSIDPTTGSGWLTLEISDEAIAQLGVPAEAPALLGEGVNPYTGKSISLYRLPGGAFQINTEYADGKPYIFVWDNLGNNWHLAW